MLETIQAELLEMSNESKEKEAEIILNTTKFLVDMQELIKINNIYEEIVKMKIEVKKAVGVEQEVLVRNIFKMCTELFEKILKLDNLKYALYEERLELILNKYQEEITELQNKLDTDFLDIKTFEMELEIFRLKLKKSELSRQQDFYHYQNILLKNYLINLSKIKKLNLFVQ